MRIIAAILLILVSAGSVQAQCYGSRAGGQAFGRGFNVNLAFGRQQQQLYPFAQPSPQIYNGQPGQFVLPPWPQQQQWSRPPQVFEFRFFDCPAGWQPDGFAAPPGFAWQGIYQQPFIGPGRQ